MTSPTVTVVMATYNHADFVVQAIDSVLSQRNVNFEFLIADDGSYDQTREVVASIHDERIRFFPYQVNRGACDVTNELIQRASGEFIAVINSDDCWSNGDKLAYQLQVLRDDPALGACFGRARFVDKLGREIDKSSLSFGDVFDQQNRSQGAWLRRFFEFGNCLCHPTILIRKSCYDELGMYRNSLRQLPDLDMWIRLIKRYPIHVSERELIQFRVLPGQNASGQVAENAIRTINEHYLISDTFFDGVDASLLIDGFGDLMKCNRFLSDEHLEIEKAMLFLKDNRFFGKHYRLIWLLALNRFLKSPLHREILLKFYGIDDLWFQREVANIDVLRPRAIAELRYRMARLRDVFKRSLEWCRFH
jgi:glycosyltransferase involved in cell wall biosynthesis